MRAARASFPWLALALGCTSAPPPAVSARAAPSSSAAPSTGPPAAAKAKAARPDASCTYRVAVAEPSARKLRVDARCEGADTTGFSVTEPAALAFVHGDDGA